MGWKDLNFRDRWALVASSVQAAATLGAFAVALVGIWRVAPIITYQVQKQRSEALPETGREGDVALSSRFTNEAIAWWVPQVRAYGRIIELIRTREDRGAEVTYTLVEAPEPSTGVEPLSDLLAVTAKRGAGRPEVVEVQVNPGARLLGHFIQRQINRGVFEALEPETRERVESAVESYVRAHILPSTPAPNIRPDMTLDEVADEIELHQESRVEAAHRIAALRELVETTLRE